MGMEEEQKILKKSPALYALSGRLLPRKIRADMLRLLSFIKVAGTYSTGNKDDQRKLHDLEVGCKKAIADHAFDATAHQWDSIDSRAVKHLVRLQHKFKFDASWIDAFFEAKRRDAGASFKTLDESMGYVYGSAEVVGMMIAKILKLPESSYGAVKAQARAIQWATFIRDVADHANSGRQYFPSSEVKKFGLENLAAETIKQQPEKFKKFIQFQIDRYKKWQAEADSELHLVPERLRMPITTMVDMYSWTIRKIERNPLIVADTKVRPHKRQVIRHVIKNTARGTARATAKTTRQARRQVRRIRPGVRSAVPKVRQVPAAIKKKTKDLKNEMTDRYLED